MKKPRMEMPLQPYKPMAPLEPKEFHEVETELNDLIGVYSGTLDLEGLVKHLPKGLDAKALRFEVVEVGGERYYGGDPYFNVSYVEQRKNIHYAKQQVKYQKELAKHAKKMEKYAKEFAQYEEELAVYNAWLAEKNLKADAAELKRLKKRIKELEKGTK